MLTREILAGEIDYKEGENIKIPIVLNSRQQGKKEMARRVAQMLKKENKK